MSASKQIDKLIAGLTDWRGRAMANLRKVINDADSKLTEEFKWNTAVWSAEGNVCALGAFKDHIKIAALTQKPRGQSISTRAMR